VIVGNINAIADRHEDLVLWRNPARRPWLKPEGKGAKRAPYNGSLVFHKPGTRPDIWFDFIEGKLPALLRYDQDWLSRMAGVDCPYWDESDGVYRLARDDTPGSGVSGELPDNARIVFFPGDRGKPWLPHIMEANPWIAEYRR